MNRAAMRTLLVLVGLAALVVGCEQERELPDYTPEIQLLREHIGAVLDAVDEFSEPRLLIWGVGFDSELWCNENERGTTVFIEDIPKWAKLARSKMDCRIVMVEYDTVLKQAYGLADHPDRLTLELPDDLENARFDVIVVDAPHGFAPNSPGRMKPIYMSSVLSHEGSHVFVDDMGRAVERAYSERYLEPKFGKPTLLEGRGGFAHYSNGD